MSMDRREFIKLVGGGAVLVGVAALAGCPSEAPESEAPPVAVESVDPPGGPEGGAAAGVTKVKCPQCGAENVVRAAGAEITCWKCGHKWTPA